MDSQIKQLEILAQGTYVQKMFARILLGFGILAGIFIVSCSAVLINATNKYHDYMINTEEVVYTESVEEFYGEDLDAGGHIIQDNTIDNSTIGGVYGTSENKSKTQN